MTKTTSTIDCPVCDEKIEAKMKLVTPCPDECTTEGAHAHVEHTITHKCTATLVIADPSKPPIAHFKPTDGDHDAEA